MGLELMSGTRFLIIIQINFAFINKKKTKKLVVIV